METIRLFFWSPKSLQTVTAAIKLKNAFNNILKSRDITLLTKVCLVKAKVFPVVICDYEIWSIKRAEH